MEYKEPTRLDCESLPSDEDDLQGVSSSPTCQSQSHDGSLGHLQLNKSKEIMGDLELGMEFSSKESVYDYYYNYARDKANHNHALVRTPMKHMLKINRKMSRAQKAHANDADKSGIPIKELWN
ncbi:hypothetical protein ACFX15_037108 [Malus domestica]